MNIMAASGANPRKFAEKIALHNQKGAEEEAEFRKIMSECAAVKGNVVTQPQQPQQQHQPRPSPVMRPPVYHLSPVGPAPRHGSLPNVSCQMNPMQNHIMATSPPSIMAGSLMQHSSPLAISGSHHSLRDSRLGSSASATNMHISSSLRGSGGSATLTAGPIRASKHRKDTSPYGSERLSNSNVPAGVTSSHCGLLIPPDSSSSWRRVKSDPFLHSSVNFISGGGGSSSVSPAGSISDAPSALQGSNGAISPLHGASPTMQRRVPYMSNSQPHHHHGINNDVQTVKNSLYSLALPEPSSDLKPGSLPDLTNIQIGQPSGANSSANISAGNCCAPSMVSDDQGSPYSSSSPNGCRGSSPTYSWSPGQGHLSSPSSPTSITNRFSHPSLPVNVGFNYYPQPRHNRHQSLSATSGGSMSIVRLSDNEISKILSIPMSLVSDNNIDEQAKNVNVQPVTSTTLCDSTNRNLLHLNKGIAVDQQQQQQSRNLMYSPNMGMSSQQTNDTSQNCRNNQQPGKLSSSMSNYRNSQSIPPPASPGMHGSPMGRSTSPVDVSGSPHSPGTGSLGSSAPIYSEAVMMAGQNYQHYMELTKDVQKLSVLENSSGNEQGMYIPHSSGYTHHQPITDFVDMFSNHQQNNLSHHQYANQISSPNPQTPSSIPDIILTGADDGSDQAFQTMIGMSNDFDCFSAEDFKEGLGKLDDTMIRLLSDSGAMDQQLADPATEEHLKNV